MSNWPAIRSAGTPEATAAFRTRAPSRWSAKAELACGRDDRVDLLERPDAAPGGIVGVLDGDDSRWWGVRPVALTEGRAELFRREAAVRAWKLARHQARVHGRAAQLRDEEVRILLGDHLTARRCQRPQRDFVRHRRRWDEDGLVLPQELRHARLERVDGRVLTPLLVAHLRSRDCGSHFCGRLRLGIGAKVDHQTPFGASATASAGSPERSGCSPKP